MHSDVERLRYERKREKGLVKIGVTVGVGSHGFEWTKDRTGRGKKKKLIKALIPFIIGLKMKLGLFAVLAYFVIALIAKKAILASLISLAISGFIAIKKLSQHHQPHHEVVEHHAHAGWSAPSSYSSGGWDSYGGGGHDAHGAYSNQVAHSVAYNGQKPVRR
ncbi:uncharacterized protein LOC103518989 [Diaphorina citri]|uniref:Uncharacterized protein LOC103518989 n=1 Tax=Diaphorina citri TaxID=121845 RepID=A0A1S3DI88_DIACI|nr:uncharacterized protein LOC103518989 [Diaphorina citri]